MKNIDKRTVQSFGAEWTRYNQYDLQPQEQIDIFESYFNIFPWQDLSHDAEGFDMGCGSGRWATIVAERIGTLNCIDPSSEALRVARHRLTNKKNVRFFQASASDNPLPANSQDFGYSLGVLHHVPDTQSAIQDCVSMLKPGAPFLIYLYYNFDNRPFWYQTIWRISNFMRKILCRLPETPKNVMTDILAAVVYWPLARLACAGEKLGLNVQGWLLSSYRDLSFYTMRTDARDRFGTPLEQRFTKPEIEEMMKRAGLKKIFFSETAPFWCAVGRKATETI